MIKKIIVIGVSLLLLLGLTIVNAAILNPKQLFPDEKTITTSKIDDSDILVAFFSDVHFGQYVDMDELNNVISLINDYNPDIVFFGGDLIGSGYNCNDNQKTAIAVSLASINAKYGTYAVLGDEDNIDVVSSIYDQAQIKLLNNINVTINVDNIDVNIVGISPENNDINNAFLDINSNNYTYVLCHYPDYFDDVLNYEFDYMCAGHSMGGQIYIPLISMLNRTYGCENYFKGSYSKNNTTLDITNGIGRKNSNARFLADQEVNFYKLVPALNK